MWDPETYSISLLSSFKTKPIFPRRLFVGWCTRDQFLIKMSSFRIEWQSYAYFPCLDNLKHSPPPSTPHSRIFSTTSAQHKPRLCMTHVRMWQVICNQQSVNVCKQIPGYPYTNTIIPGYPYTDTTLTARHSCMLFRRERKVESQESYKALPWPPAQVIYPVALAKPQLLTPFKLWWLHINVVI